MLRPAIRALNENGFVVLPRQVDQAILMKGVQACQPLKLAITNHFDAYGAHIQDGALNTTVSVEVLEPYFVVTEIGIVNLRLLVLRMGCVLLHGQHTQDNLLGLYQLIEGVLK